MATEVYRPVFGRRQLPPDDAPGRPIAQEDVAAGCGDPRDWFTPVQRLDAAMDAEAKHLAHRDAPLNTGLFQYGIIGLGGPMGAGKSTIAGLECALWYIFGHQFLQPGGWLFGRIVDNPSEFYDVVESVRLYTSLAWDEAHSGLEAQMASSEGVALWTQLLAGMRKKACRVFLPSAMLHLISPQIRWALDQVWVPVPIRTAHKSPAAEEEHKAKPAHSRPENFILVVRQWKDNPLRNADPRKKGGYMGMGRPDHRIVYSPYAVRAAKILTDTFKPVEAGVARRSAGKAARAESAARVEQENMSGQDVVKMATAVHAGIQAGLTRITPGELAAMAGLPGHDRVRYGAALSRLFAGGDTAKFRNTRHILLDSPELRKWLYSRWTFQDAPPISNAQTDWVSVLTQ